MGKYSCPWLPFIEIATGMSTCPCHTHLVTSPYRAAQHPFPVLHHPSPHTIARSTTSSPSALPQVRAVPDCCANTPQLSKQPLAHKHSDRNPHPVARSDIPAAHPAN